MDELQFEFDTPNAGVGASALETEEIRRINLITIIVKLMILLRQDENMLVMQLNAYSRGVLNKLSEKHVSGNVTLREILNRLYFVKLDDAGRKILQKEDGIMPNANGVLVGGKRMTKSKSKSKSKSRSKSRSKSKSKKHKRI
jgi:hypothetical protein